MNSWLHYDFVGRALLAGLLMSVTCGLLSPFIVLRRLAYSADGLAHASLGGLALGLFILNTGVTPTLGSYAVSFLFTCVVAAAIAYFSGGDRLQSDTAVGACYVAAFSVGILLLSLKGRGGGHLEHFFFGSILSVDSLECRLLGALTALSFLFCFGFWRWLGQWIFDEELARASGVKTIWLRYGLILLIAATVIFSTMVVGLLLVTALLILPGAIATLSARSLRVMVLLSVAAALTSVMTGIALSTRVETPPGPAIVLVAFALFLAAFFFRRHRDQRTWSSHTARAAE